MIYEVLESPNYPGEWRAEAVGPDGKCLTVMFSGPDAKSRAEAYADWRENEEAVRALRIASELPRPVPPTPGEHTFGIIS